MPALQQWINSEGGILLLISTSLSQVNPHVEDGCQRPHHKGYNAYKYTKDDDGRRVPHNGYISRTKKISSYPEE
jgi:hypothetical protein